MSERPGTAEDFAKMAAALRGQDDLSTKQEANREIAEAVHPPEPEEPQPEEAQTERELFVQRLFAPKPGHADLVRWLHPTESEES